MPQGTFGRAPALYGSDRGFFSEQNVKSCKQDGVKVVCIPQCGGKKTAKRKAYEKSSDFKAGQRFRAGIEGRISVLFRGRGMKRLPCRGPRALRIVGRCGSARQQLDENCRLAIRTNASQTQSSVALRFCLLFLSSR